MHLSLVFDPNQDLILRLVFNSTLCTATSLYLLFWPHTQMVDGSESQPNLSAIHKVLFKSQVSHFYSLKKKLRRSLILTSLLTTLKAFLKNDNEKLQTFDIQKELWPWPVNELRMAAVPKGLLL